MKISHYIFLSFIIILILFSITTYINFRFSQVVTENTAYFSKSTNIVRNSGRFQRNLLSMVNGLRGYLLTGENAFIESYDASSNENDSILQELSFLLTDSSQSHLLNEIKQLNDEWTKEYTEPLKQAKTLSRVSSKNLDTFSSIYKAKFASGHERIIQTRLQEKFRAFTAHEYAIRDARKEILSALVNKTRKLSLILIVLSVITALLVVTFLVIKISKRIRQLTTMANDIAAGNYNVSIRDTGKDELSSLSQSLNHMASELSKNISLLKRSNAELDQFAHIVSHDMKGPLRGISNVISWIEEDHKNELTPKVNEYVELIKGRVVRAENLVEGLLSYARADKEETEKEMVDLNALVDEVLENLPVSENTNISVSQLPVIFSEKVLLYQVFYNLIGNAIKYNDKEDPEVSIYYEEHDTSYEFFIKDNGMGIPENHHKRIFVIFQTLKDRDSFESTGVGLAIIKKILDSKKLHIGVMSEPGMGSTFSFTWPKN
jgi:signal transduction histidine kinase